MGTRFEVVLFGDNAPNLRAAGEEVLEEVSRLEAVLSIYRPGSEMSRVNAEAAERPVTVSPPLFALLERCAELTRRTEGAFDISVGPLLRCWGFLGGSGALADPSEVEAARALVGMEKVLLDPEELTVAFERPGMMLDLGSIGKGYALEQAGQLLLGSGITTALLHGGTSTVLAFGAPPDAQEWTIGLQDPAEPEGRLGLARLRDNSLSVSGVHGKGFEAGGQRYGHVLDPRTGWPVRPMVPGEGEPRVAAVVTHSATDADALSTALLVHGPAWLPRLVEDWPGSRGLVGSWVGEGRPLVLASLRWDGDAPAHG
jgi:thiamine biosynthesis lipoprotein